MSSNEKTVSQVAFDEDGTIVIAWADPKDQTDQVGTACQTYVTLEGQEADANVAYWGNELRQAAVEFLHATLRSGR